MYKCEIIILGNLYQWSLPMSLFYWFVIEIIIIKINLSQIEELSSQKTKDMKLTQKISIEFRVLQRS